MSCGCDSRSATCDALTSDRSDTVPLKHRVQKAAVAGDPVVELQRLFHWYQWHQTRPLRGLGKGFSAHSVASEPTMSGRPSTESGSRQTGGRADRQRQFFHRGPPLRRRSRPPQRRRREEEAERARERESSGESPTACRRGESPPRRRVASAPVRCAGDSWGDGDGTCSTSVPFRLHSLSVNFPGRARQPRLRWLRGRVSRFSLRVEELEACASPLCRIDARGLAVGVVRVSSDSLSVVTSVARGFPCWGRGRRAPARRC